LDYFQESSDIEELATSGNCCDVCLLDEHVEMVDCQAEIVAIAQTVKNYPDKGEKQVGCKLSA
jgi:hypothetical protein